MHFKILTSFCRCCALPLLLLFFILPFSLGCVQFVVVPAAAVMAVVVVVVAITGVAAAVVWAD